MAVARIAAVALALCACTALAQEHAQTTLTVAVTDPTGAVIPSAHIVATDKATGLRFEGATDGTGQAIVHLDQGTYELSVQAAGFHGYLEKEVEVKREMRRDVTLLAGSKICTVCVEQGPEIPSLERQIDAAELPLIPLQEINLPGKRLRHRLRWF